MRDAFSQSVLGWPATGRLAIVAIIIAALWLMVAWAVAVA